MYIKPIFSLSFAFFELMFALEKAFLSAVNYSFADWYHVKRCPAIEAAVYPVIINWTCPFFVDFRFCCRVVN